MVEDNDEEFEGKPDDVDVDSGRLVGIVSVEVVIVDVVIVEDGNASPSYKMDKRS